MAWFYQCWLVRGGPEVAVVHVAHVAEGAPVVAGAVFAPARDRLVFPAAVAAAGIGHHHVIAAVGQQLGFRHRGAVRGEHAQRHAGIWRRGANGRRLHRRGIEGAHLWAAFLQHQQGRLQQWIGFETALHRTVVQQVAQRQEAHALVVDHERTDHGVADAARQARWRVVDRLVEAVASHEAQAIHFLQVQARRFGLDHQAHHAGVRRDHQVVAEAALQAQARHAEGAVLVIEVGVGGVVARLRNPPRHVVLLAVRDLGVDHRVVGLVEQRALVRWHHQERHQVFEHRAAPGQQHRLAADDAQLAAQRKPVVLRQLALGNRDKTGQAHFGGQQVVVAGVQAAFADVVADRQQVGGGVVQEAVFHLRERGAALGQVGQLAHAVVGGRAALLQQLRHVLAAFEFGRRQVGDGNLGAGVGQRCQLAQGRHAQQVGVEHGVGRQVYPRCKQRQFVERGVGLAGQRFGPHADVGIVGEQRAQGVCGLRHAGEPGVQLLQVGGIGTSRQHFLQCQQFRRAGDCGWRYRDGTGVSAGIDGSGVRTGGGIGIDRADGFLEHAQGGQQAVHVLRADHGLVVHANQARLQREQVAGQVAAIDGGDIHRVQRL